MRADLFLGFPERIAAQPPHSARPPNDSYRLQYRWFFEFGQHLSGVRRLPIVPMLVGLGGCARERRLPRSDSWAHVAVRNRSCGCMASEQSGWQPEAEGSKAMNVYGSWDEVDRVLTITKS